MTNLIFFYFILFVFCFILFVVLGGILRFSNDIVIITTINSHFINAVNSLAQRKRIKISQNFAGLPALDPKMIKQVN